MIRGTPVDLAEAEVLGIRVSLSQGVITKVKVT